MILKEKQFLNGEESKLPFMCTSIPQATTTLQHILQIRSPKIFIF